MRTLLISTVAFLLLNPNALAQEEGGGRFQMSGPAPIVVIDTATGQLWVVTGNAPDYYMRQVCYLGPNHQLMPTPYENTFTNDLAQFRALCSRTN